MVKILELVKDPGIKEIMILSYLGQLTNFAETYLSIK